MSPFLDLHERAGGEHPRRYLLCFSLDLLLRLIVISTLLLIVAAVAWKTLAPLPGLSAQSCR